MGNFEPWVVCELATPILEVGEAFCSSLWQLTARDRKHTVASNVIPVK